MGILGLAKEGIRDDIGGIVNGADEGEPRASSLEPIKPTGVKLEQHALLRVAFAPAAMLGRAPSARTGHAGIQKDATE